MPNKEKQTQINTQNIVVAERTDGLGSRMISVLTALFLAKKLGDIRLFKFVWEEERFFKQDQYNISFQGEKGQKIIGMSCETRDKIFSQSFIEQFYIPSYDRDSSVQLPLGKFRSFKAVREEFFNTSNKNARAFVYGLSDVFWLLQDLNTQEDRKMLAESFWDITFCDAITQVIAFAKEEATKLGDFVALHIRSGDTIYDYSDVRKWNMVSVRHATYAELALNLAKMSAKDKKVVLVGDDITSLREIVRIAKNENIMFIEDFKQNKIDSNLQHFFFDVLFMSQATSVYGTNSAVARLANYIGNQNFTNNYSVFTLLEQYEFLNRDYEILPLIPSQKAFSLFHKMILGEQIGEGIDTLITYARGALQLDYENEKYHIYLLKYLINKDLKLAEEYAKEVLQLKVSFFKILLIRGWFGIAYAPLFPTFTKEIVQHYPYLSFLASKIYEFQNNLNQALKFAKLAYEKEPKNEIFKEHLFNVLLQREKQPPKPQVKEIIKEKPIPAIYLIKAKHRIHNHLAYKLGSAIILNSKSLWGYIRMPYVLSYIKESHNKEQKQYEAKIKKNPKLKLPKLESYQDYKEALKEKECFTYKLGEALIKANSVRGGGQLFAYLKFFQKVRELRKEFEVKTNIHK